MQECYIVSSNKKFSRTLGGHPQITKSEGEGKGSAAEDYKDYMGGGVKGSAKDCTVFPSEFRIFLKYGAPAAKISRHSH